MNYSDEQLYNMGLIRDQRRRYVLVNKDFETGTHIQERDMNIFSFLSGKRLFIYLVYTVSLGIFKLPLIVSVLLALVVFIAFYLFENFYFFKEKVTLKLAKQDIRVLHGLPFQ